MIENEKKISIPFTLTAAKDLIKLLRKQEFLSKDLQEQLRFFEKEIYKYISIDEAELFFNETDKN